MKNINLLKLALLGLISATFALIAEIFIINPMIDPQTLFESHGIFLVLAALIEEISKFSLLHHYFFRFPEKSRTFQQAVIFGIGFSVLEMILFFIGNSVASDKIVIGALSVLAVHILTSTILVLALARPHAPKKIALLSLFVATLVHSSYNLLVAREVDQMLLLFIFSAFLPATIFLFPLRRRWSA